MDRIKELTERVYQEGVQRGNEEADRLVSEAQEKARRIVEEAELRSQAIVEAGQRKADALRQSVLAELRLTASQLVESVRGSLQECLVGEIASDNVKASLVQPEFVRNFVFKLVERFEPNQGLVIETAEAESLKNYLASNVKELLSRGIEIRQVAGRPAHFSVGPQDGSFKLTFGEAEFIELFREFLSPQLANLLYNQK